MRTMHWLGLALVVGTAACGRSHEMDEALKTDLALASQAQSYAPQQFVSPEEAGYAAQPQYAPRTIQTVARQPVARSAPVARRTTPRAPSSSNGGYYPASTGQQTVERHTRRDAALGAAAGAILGAAASRDKVKGGLIGAAAGGIIGAVIGNKVDIDRNE